MTTPQSAQYTANVAFLHLIDKNDATARKIPAFYRHTQTLRTYMSQAQAADMESKQSTSGMTQDKNQNKVNLFEEMKDFTTIVSGFASEKNNNVLSNRVNNFTTIFGKTRQNDVATLCRGILDEVRPFLPDLVDYAITKETLTGIEDLIDTYEGKVPQTRSKVKEKKVGTSNRDEVFDLMADLMENKILKVAVGFKKNDPEFHKQVTAAAEVDATGAKQTIIKLILKTESGSKRDPQTLMARTMDSDTHLTPNAKGEITFKFEKGGLKDLEVPIEGGEPIKLTGIRIGKGKTKRVVVNV